MAETDTKFIGSIPAVYEELLVPLIFQPYADILAAKLKLQAPHDVLETAAGTGVVTRAIAAALPEARIVATDLNSSMLEVAKAKQRAGQVTWQQADAQNLPFARASFDAVICQFGAMFFPDRVKAYSEARRVLHPNGVYLVCLWDNLTTNPFAEVVANTLKQLYSQDPPNFFERVPYGYHDAAAIAQDLRDGGFRNVMMERVPEMAEAESAKAVATAFCQGTPLRNEIELRKSVSLADATAAATHALEGFFGSGPVEAPIQAVIVTAS